MRKATVFKPIPFIIVIAIALAITIIPSVHVFADSLDTQIYQKYDQLKSAGINLGNQVSGIKEYGLGKYLHYQNGSIYCNPYTGAYVIRNGIKAKYDSVDGLCAIGYPKTDELPITNGCYQQFEAGYIYWTPSIGCVIVKGQIKFKYLNLGAEKSFLGYPLADEIVVDKTSQVGDYKIDYRPDSYQHFQGGTLYNTPKGTYYIRNGFKSKFDQVGGYDVVGLPTSDEIPSKNGCLQHFELYDMYWSSSTGSYMIKRTIDKYKWLGGETGYLGYPTMDEARTSDGYYYCHFQGGSIYYSPAGYAYVVQNAIKAKWESLNAEKGFLGYPTTDEIKSANNGCYQRFKGGYIYWSPSTGAKVTVNAMKEKYFSIGESNSSLGYPTTDEFPVGSDGFCQNFQNGSIYWRASTGANIIYNNSEMTDKWISTGGINGVLGYPASDLKTINLKDGQIQHFERGSIYWSYGSGVEKPVAVINAISNKYKALGSEKSYLGYPITDELPVPGTQWLKSEFDNGVIIWSSATGALDMPRIIYESENYKKPKGKGGLGLPTSSLKQNSDGTYSQSFEYGKVIVYYANGVEKMLVSNLKLDVPKYNQNEYTKSNLCWATCASMAISYFLNDRNDRKIEIGIDKARNLPIALNSNSGGFPSDIAHYVKKYTGREGRVIVGPGPMNSSIRNVNALAYAAVGPLYIFWDITDNEIAKQAPCEDRSFSYEEIADNIIAGKPVVAHWCANNWDYLGEGHFIIITGFNRNKDGSIKEIIYIDPAGGILNTLDYASFKNPDSRRYFADIVVFD